MARDVDLSRRQEMLLLLISKADDPGLDPVRIMKGQFLLAMETPEDWMESDARYEFVPYNYGPYSSEIYRDLATLERIGLISGTALRGRSWRYYVSTGRGTRFAKNVSSNLSPDLVNYVGQILAFICSLSFTELLRAIYHKYPAFAVNSVFASPEQSG